MSAKGSPDHVGRVPLMGCSSVPMLVQIVASADPLCWGCLIGGRKTYMITDPVVTF